MLNKMILLINPRKWDNILFNNIYEIKNLDKTEYIFYFFCSIFSDKGCDIIFIVIYTKDQTILYTLDYTLYYSSDYSLHLSPDYSNYYSPDYSLKYGLDYSLNYSTV